MLVLTNIYILTIFSLLVNEYYLNYNELMKKQETIQNYLEAIHIIGLNKKEVKAIDVVNYMNFSRPTVSIALKSLEKDDFIIIDNNKISLTKKGLDEATKMYERHEYIAQVLMKLGVQKDVAYEDSCLIEHDISDESFDAIKKATAHLFNCSYENYKKSSSN